MLVIHMAAIIRKLHLTLFALLVCLPAKVLGEDLLSCETTTPHASSGYTCNVKESENQCKTFVILSTNSYFSSLSNLSLYLAINRFAFAEANGFSAATEFLPKDQPLLLPIDCKCNGVFFEAVVTKTTIKGESFYGISESLEGLTTCKAIRDKNPGILPVNLADKVRLLVPLRCACPSLIEVNSATRLLLAYPVSQGDTISNLAAKFNTTPQAIISANSRSLPTFKPSDLKPQISVLIPLKDKPSFGPLAKPVEPNLHFPANRIPVINRHKKKSKMLMIGVYVAVAGVVVGAGIAIAAAFLMIQSKKKQQNAEKGVDLELQKLSLSIRTTSEKKVSFDGSVQHHLDDHMIIDTTPRKALIETYTVEELRKATEDFSSSNHIEGSVYHGRLNGKNLAIKRTRQETISKIDLGLFQVSTHRHPNIMRLLGTCSNDGTDSFLVFEYAKNGSLKDWLHGGLAIKNQFIASCYCFLAWNQRIKICLDVAVALQYMHHIMNPTYVHRNIKSRNIFLDEDFNTKIGNFGMAKCNEDDTKDRSLNSTSLGYLAPEYVNQGVVSPSIDIFAYGVVLLEVLSGKMQILRADENGEKGVSLSMKTKSVLASENADALRGCLDSALGENYSFDAAVTVANLARACTEEDPSLRPNAGEIVEKLLRLVEESPEKELILNCESSSKPLVQAAAATSL